MAPDSINTIGGDITVNGRTYRLPKQPVVVVCVDGSEPGYIERAVEAGRAPWFAQGAEDRAPTCSAIASCRASPTRTISRSSPAGRRRCTASAATTSSIRDTGKEVMMNDPKFLRATTLFPAFQRAGASVAVVTAKDKLRGLLGKGLELGAGKACCFSSEKSDKATLAENGIENVNDAGRHGRAGRLQRRPLGVRLRRRRQADGARPAGHHVSLDHRLHPAQARAGHAGRQRLLRHDGRLPGQARRHGLHHRADRRPRHERQVSAPTASPT